jgi:opacity protein-like surface antigen
MVRRLLSAGAAVGALAVLATALATPAVAQDRERLFRIGFSGGAAVPTGDLTTIANAGLAVQGFVQVAPSGLPGVFRIGALYSRFAAKDGAFLTLPPTPEGSGIPRPQAPVDGTELLGGLASARFDLSKGSVRPYLIGGLGAINVRQQFATLQSGGTTNEIRFSVDGGAGFSFNLAGADAFIEARFTNIFGADKIAPELSAIRVIPISFGVVF